VGDGLGGSPEPCLKDPETGEIKRPTKEDMINTTRLGNALPNIDFVMSIAGSYDKPLESQYLHDLDALINNTDKPIICSAPGSQISQYILEMTSSIVGKDQLINRCPIALVTASISPLVFTKMNEDIIEFAKHGIPIVFAPCPMIGATGPGTQIGTFIISNAETLAAVVLTQIIRPGTPIVYSANTTVMDMRTGRFSYGAPETTISRIITAQMAHFYRLPTFGQLAGGTDSMVCDAQAGAEVMMDSIICVVTGINLNQNYGTLAGGSVGSMEMAIISDEIIGMISRIMKGVKINHETLALAVIKEIGPSGNFLTHEHTLKWFKHELYEPKLFNRLSPEQWIKDGKKNVEQIASEKIQLLLEKSNNIVPLSEKANVDLAGIILKAEKKLCSRSQS